VKPVNPMKLAAVTATRFLCQDKRQHELLNELNAEC
jgi:hypothetical protein